MKRALLAAFTAFALSSVAFAQNTTVAATASTTAPAANATEQRSQIRSYAFAQTIAALPLQGSGVMGKPPLTRGTFKTVPDDWGPDMTRYRYVQVNRPAFV